MVKTAILIFKRQVYLWVGALFNKAIEVAQIQILVFVSKLYRERGALIPHLLLNLTINDILRKGLSSSGCTSILPHSYGWIRNLDSLFRA
jgi:hypothetical protein